MKTAIYIEDGIVQLVLTPESDFEKNALSAFSNSDLQTDIFNGSFYDCRGGWTRQQNYSPRNIYNVDSNDKSLILRTIKRNKIVDGNNS